MYDDAKYAAVKDELYALVDKYNAKSGEDVVKSIKASKKASVFWQQAGGYIVPYTNEDNVAYGMASYGTTFPKLCSTAAPKAAGAATAAADADAAAAASAR